jgi:hypothetical protein
MVEPDENEEYNPEEIIEAAADRTKIELRLQALQFAMRGDISADAAVMVADRYYQWLLTGNTRVDRINE